MHICPLWPHHVQTSPSISGYCWLRGLLSLPCCWASLAGLKIKKLDPAFPWSILIHQRDLALQLEVSNNNSNRRSPTAQALSRCQRDYQETQWVVESWHQMTKVTSINFLFSCLNPSMVNIIYICPLELTFYEDHTKSGEYLLLIHSRMIYP